DDDEPVEVSGRVVESKQGMVEPTNNEFPVENSLVVKTDDDGEVTVGGQGAFVEDVEADLVRIEADESGPDETDAGNVAGDE
ncbi:transcriptional regulator, partial [Halorubrum sp. E3]